MNYFRQGGLAFRTDERLHGWERAICGALRAACDDGNFFYDEGSILEDSSFAGKAEGVFQSELNDSGEGA